MIATRKTVRDQKPALVQEQRYDDGQNSDRRARMTLGEQCSG